MTADLAGWLLACVAEDEENAERVHEVGCVMYSYMPDPCDCGMPSRVLAECAAKRALIAGVAGDPFDAMGAEWRYEAFVLGCLAVGFADRPGFREEWRP